MALVVLLILIFAIDFVFLFIYCISGYYSKILRGPLCSQADFSVEVSALDSAKG